MLASHTDFKFTQFSYFGDFTAFYTWGSFYSLDTKDKCILLAISIMKIKYHTPIFAE